ncbi:MAG TPA: hypothetical protein PK668_04710 [Myxococcota bacterium]|nr:hypothetical protein [Myxococcota bacterium]HRY92162.1 hypothetical protein [Myxococcota bacterium]HSA20646.1 hypothetical protein [Myxococcota bacterium]
MTRTTAKGKRREEKIWLDDQERLERLAHLLAREIDRVVFDLEFRRDLLLKLWSKERIRVPLLRVMSARYYESDLDMLVLFPPDAAQMLDDFYRTLDTFIFYVSYTEDMPNTMAQRFDVLLQDLKDRSGPLLKRLAQLGPTDLEANTVTDSGPTLAFEDHDGRSMKVFEDTDPRIKLPPLPPEAPPARPDRRTQAGKRGRKRG